jgi:hypothetical protein
LLEKPPTIPGCLSALYPFVPPGNPKQGTTTWKRWLTISDATGKKTIPAQSEHSFSAKAKFLRVTVDALGSGWTTFTELKPLFKAQ